MPLFARLLAQISIISYNSIGESVHAGLAQAKLEVDRQSLQDIEAAMKGLGSKWPSVDLTEEEEENWREDLFRSEARLLVQEEVRLSVDAEMRESLHRSKVFSTDNKRIYCLFASGSVLHCKA